MTDLSEIKAMAEKMVTGDLGYSTASLARAVLDYIKSQEPVRERDWEANYDGAIADLNSLIDCCKRVCVENDIPGLRAFLALNYPAYIGLGKSRITGEEGVGPEGKPEEKAGREWWIVTLGLGNRPAAFHAKQEALKFLSQWHQAETVIRVREVIE